jgi:hypothetical protein
MGSASDGRVTAFIRDLGPGTPEGLAADDEGNPHLPMAKSFRAAEAALNIRKLQHENLTQSVQKMVGQGL